MIDLDELERLALKPVCTTDEVIQLADAVAPLIERIRELEAENADLRRELKALMERQ